MAKINKIWIVLSIIILGAIIMITVILPLHPLFRSPKRVLNDTLKLTPMGTHIDDVAAIVKSQTIIKNATESRAPIIRYDSGYVNPRGEVPGWPTISGSRSIVGYKSITVAYRTHFYMYISIYWGFDEDGKLIDVFVAKDLDMLPRGSVRKTAD